jgi:FlaG/FlaF family flagellin (archaellin)
MRSLRAISPVVATALLIIIAVVTAVVLYMWVSGMVGQQPTQQTKVQEAIRIEAVNATYDSTNKQWTISDIFVRNVGSVTVNVTDVYVYDAQTNVLLNHTALHKGVLIPPGNATNVLEAANTTINIKITTTSILVKVVTKDGVEATYLVTRSA